MIKYSSKSVCSNTSWARRTASTPGTRVKMRNKMPALRNRLYAAVLLALSGVAQAMPEGGEVVAGEASITVSGGTMNVQQSTQRAVINFQSFDVASQETVNFHQPNSDAVVLNRVVGSNLSEIHGTINANGQVYLINPNGVLFGNGAQLDVGGLVVTTLDIADQDFLAGRDTFTGAAKGTIENRGIINAEGRVVLLAPEVINRGDIHVPDGDITLRASQQALLHTPGSGIPILVDSSEFIGQVTNEGHLQAGNIAMVLDGVSQRDVYDAVINNTGLVRAARVSGSGGSIELYAPGGDVNNMGTLNASAIDGNGGAVAIGAERIFQSGVITTTAVNDGQGGTIDLLASEGIVMHSGSAMDASADVIGDGGKVIVLADNATWFTEDASIRARGGDESGDGGFVEVSGQEFVSVAGTVDVGASGGKGGLWFIDPTDITITSNFDSDGSFSGSDPDTWTLTDSPDTSLINVTTLRNTLINSGDVLISSVSDGNGLGNITFDAALDYDGIGATHTLTLQAYNQIIFTDNGRIFDSNTASADGLNFTATAANGFTMAADSLINAGQGAINISTAAGDAVITGLISRQNISGTANAGTAVQSVRVAAPTGSILSANPATLDIEVKDTGLTLSAMGEIGDLFIESDFIDVVSTTGNITLREFQSTSVYRMQTPGTAFITAGAQFAVELATPFDVQNLHITAGTDFRIADSGFSVPGNLTVVANNLRGDAATVGAGSAATPVILAANNADITLTNGTLERHWNTNFNQLALNISGGSGAFTLVDNSGLRLTSAATGGNASFTTNNADLVLTATPLVDGNLNLTTIGSGDLILPDTGLFHDGNLSLLADNLLDSDTTITLGAANADITLRDGAMPGSWTTSFEQLTLAITGAGGLELTDTNGLTLNSITTGGNASFATTGADLVLTETPVVAGDLGLSTLESGSVVIPAGRFTHNGGALVINADDLLDTGRTLSLEAATADITLRNPGGNHTWTTEFGLLDLAVQGAGDIEITDESGLSLGNLTLAGNGSFTTTDADLVFTEVAVVAGDLNLTTIGGGALVVANAGLAPSGGLTVMADNIASSSGSVTLGASHADITLRDGAEAQIWNTSFDHLALNVAGAGAFTLVNGSDLTLSSITTGGNASFSATNGDLVLLSEPQVEGDLTLATLGSGDLIIPSTGLQHSGLLTMTADSLRGNAQGEDGLGENNSGLTLSAETLSATLRQQQLASEWTTTLQNLDLSLSGGGALSLNNSGPLTVSRLHSDSVTSLTNTGDLRVDSVTATNELTLISGGDLSLAEANVDGDLQLSTTPTGVLIIPESGLTVGESLTVDAGRLSNSSGASETSWAANTASFRLRDTVDATTINTQTGTLSIIQDTATALTVQVAGGTQLSTLNTGGSATVLSPGDLTLTGSNFEVLGELALDVNNNLQLAAEGLTVSNDLRINAANLSTSGAGNLLLVARNGDLTLTGDQALSLTTRLNQLGVTYAAAGPFNLNNDRDLTLARVEAPAAQEVGLFVDGALTIPNTGLSAQQRLTIDAVDLQDNDRNLSLAAAQLAVSLSGANGNNHWTVSVDDLDVLIRGSANLAVTSDGGLTLADLNNDGQAVLVEDGNFSLLLTSGDLTVAGNLSATDLTADGTRAGIIDLSVAQGDLRVEGPVEIRSINQVDQDAGPDSYGIRLQLTDTSPADRTIALGEHTRLLAVGGDILIDTRPEGTAADAQRNFLQILGSALEAYNSPDDTHAGVVLINGEQAAASPGQLIRSGRTLSIVANVQEQRRGPELGNILNELDDQGKSIDVMESRKESGPNAAAQFDKVFGSCSEEDKQNSQRCRVDAALKAFLSHWLVGGELPPKTELR